MKAFPSISVQVLVAVLVTVISVFGVLSVIELKLFENRETRILREEGARAVERIAGQLAPALGTLNREETESVVRDEMGSPDVFRVLVFDKNGQLYLGKVRGADEGVNDLEAPNGGAAPVVKAALYSYSRPIIFQDSGVGRVTLALSDRAIQSRLGMMRWAIAIKLLLLLVSLSLVLLIALRVLVFRPLANLKSWVENLPAIRGAPPLRFKNAGEINLLAIALDDMAVSVSDHKRIEEALTRDISERKGAAATLHRSALQMQQSQRLEAVGQLAGGVAHDFNNLLTAINGYSDLSLERLSKDDPARSNLIEIKKAADRAASLTRQLLAFSRKQVLEPKVLDLNLVVKDVYKMLRRLIGEDIELATNAASDLGKVKADPGQVEQILLNLAVNARDAMPRGGKVTIETANVTLDEHYALQHYPAQVGEYVMLAITDTGCGMTREIQTHVFEPFFTTKEAGKGTGLGLSTVYGIVKQSGGYIWLYSEPDKGTSFKVYLPRLAASSRVEPRAQVTRGDFRGQETILLVEDEETVRNLTRLLLESNGYQVLTAVDGLEALKFFYENAKTIGLVLTDVIMPGMGGRILAERIAVLCPEMPVLYMSGYTDDAIVSHGLLGEKLDFIQKPFTAEGLMRKVREVLDRVPDVASV